MCPCSAWQVGLDGSRQGRLEHLDDGDGDEADNGDDEIRFDHFHNGKPLRVWMAKASRFPGTPGCLAGACPFLPLSFQNDLTLADAENLFNGRAGSFRY